MGVGHDFNVVRILLERGADVNAKDWFGYTALHYAAARKKTENIQLLLDFKAEMDATNILEETPLMKAVRYSNINSVKVLLEHGPRLNVKNDHGDTALDIAKFYRCENEKIIELLESQQK